MTIVTATFQNYTLQEFDHSRLYSPSEIREVKSKNAAYYEAVNKAKRDEAYAKAEAAKPKRLTEDEIFVLRVKEDEARKAEQKARQAAQEEREQAQRNYLNSFPDRAAVVASSLYGFLLEQNQWILKGYELECDTLDCLPPSHFVGYLTKPSAPAKTNKQ